MVGVQARPAVPAQRPGQATRAATPPRVWGVERRGEGAPAALTLLLLLVIFVIFFVIIIFFFLAPRGDQPGRAPDAG